MGRTPRDTDLRLMVKIPSI